MQAPLLVRPLTDAELQAVEAGRRSARAFTLRRCQIVLASARGEHVPAIARALGCDEQTVRNAIHAFNRDGLAALAPGSSRPRTIRPAFDAAGADRLKELLHRSPRDFGHPTGLWTLALAAEVSFGQLRRGPDRHPRQRRDGPRHAGAAGRALAAGKGVDREPRPGVPPKKRARDRLIRLAATHPDWVLGFEDETWWSRVEPPALHAWAEPHRPLRLVEQAVATGEPKALACYGLLLRWWEEPAEPTEAVWLRFVDGRPISAVTTRFLAWACRRLEEAGKAALLLVWDNAGWHISREVRGWIAEHNRRVKAAEAAVRIVPCPLPSKSPWLNPIEPKWVHGKRRVVEPARLLSVAELEERVYAALGADQADHLTMPDQADHLTMPDQAA
jgi:transposase